MEHSLNSQRTHTVTGGGGGGGANSNVNVTVNASSTGTSIDINNNYGGGLNVRDMAMKFNSKVEKKTNFRPAWLKAKKSNEQHPNTNTSTANATATLVAHPVKAKNNGSLIQPKRSDTKVNKETNRNVETKSQQSSPTTTAMHEISTPPKTEILKALSKDMSPKIESTTKKDVLHKAQSWRTQTVQRISPQRNRLAHPLGRPTSSKEEKEHYIPAVKRRLSKSPVRKKEERVEHGDRTQGVNDRKEREDGESSLRKAPLRSPTQEKKEDFISPLRITPKKLIFKRDGGRDIKTCAETKEFKDGLVNETEGSVLQPVSQKAFKYSTPLRNENVKALGQRYSRCALVSPEAVDRRHRDIAGREVADGIEMCISDGNHHSMIDESRDMAHDETPRKQPTGPMMTNDHSNVKENFQSRIAKFSQKKVPTNLHTNKPSRKEVVSESVLRVKGMGQKARSKDFIVEEGESDSSTKQENVAQSHAVSRDQDNDNERGRKNQSASHFWRNQIKNRRSTKVSSREENEITRNSTTQEEKQSVVSPKNRNDQTKTELTPGRVSFAQTLEEAQSPQNNNEHCALPQKTEQDVSQKPHYWVKQNSKEANISRGRNSGVSSRSRSLSQRRSNVDQNGGDLVSPRTPKYPSNDFPPKCSASLPPGKAKQIKATPSKNVQNNTKNSTSTLIVGEADIDKHDYLQYMSRSRSSRSKIDQPKVHSSATFNEDSMDVEDNEDFRNLVKSSMHKNAVRMKSTRKWPPSSQSETDLDMCDSLENEGILALDKGVSASIPLSAIPAPLSTFDRATRSPLKTKWTPRRADVRSSTRKEGGNAEERLGGKLNERKVSLSSNSSLAERTQISANIMQKEKIVAKNDGTRPVGHSSNHVNEYNEHTLRQRRENKSSAAKANICTNMSRGTLKPRWTPKHLDSNRSIEKEGVKAKENWTAKEDKSKILKAENVIKMCSPIKSRWTPRHADLIIPLSREVKADTKVGAVKNAINGETANYASRIKKEVKEVERDASCPLENSSSYSSEYDQNAVRDRRKNTASSAKDYYASEEAEKATPKETLMSRSKFSWPPSPSESLKSQETTSVAPTTPMRVEKPCLVVEPTTPCTPGPTAVRTGGREAKEMPLETPIRHNRSSEPSPASLRKAKRLENACDSSVITDTSSFVSIREVKKRLWDEGENLKMWQKEEAQPIAPKKPSEDDKQASLFKSRFHRAAEVAQKNCNENILVQINSQSLTKRDTIQPFDVSNGKDKIKEKAKEKAVAHLLAKLSSVRRDDPDEALRVIDSILEKHSEHNAKDKISSPDKIRKSTLEETFAKEQSDHEGDDGDLSEYSESDDSTVSELTNPTYMSGFGECSPRSRKQQFGTLVSKDGRLKAAHHSTRPSAFLIKDRSYPQRKPSDFPPRLPQHHGPVSRNMKPLAGSQRMAKSRISRKALPPPPPSLNAFPKPEGCDYMHSKNPSEDKATPRSTNVKSVKPKSPVKTLSAGGSSSNNRGILNKLNDWGSDSDEKEDFERSHTQKQIPNSPSVRLKKLAEVAHKLKNSNSSQQSPVRRFLYPKRDPSPREKRTKGVDENKTTMITENDATWVPSESARFFRGEFLESEEIQTRKKNHRETAADDMFDPFIEPSRGNDTFANEVLAEKFSRMEKAYQQ